VQDEVVESLKIHNVMLKNGLDVAVACMCQPDKMKYTTATMVNMSARADMMGSQRAIDSGNGHGQQVGVPPN
jgi:hypothetical protein